MKNITNNGIALRCAPRQNALSRSFRASQIAFGTRTSQRLQNSVFLLFFALLISATGPAVRGAGLVGTLVASPTSVNFQSVGVGSSKTVNIVLKNSGRGTINILHETVVGGEFSATKLSLPHSLTPGSSVTVTVAFKPNDLGASNGSIQFDSDASNPSVHYALSGTGTGLQLSATPSSASFGSVPVGTTNTQSVTLKNLGASQITISKIVASGTGFHLVNLSTPYALAAGKQVAFSIAYSPTSVASNTGSVVIDSSATNPAVTVPLTGSGVASVRTLTASPTSLSFGNDAIGSVHTQSVTLKNTGTASVTVSAIALSSNELGVGSGISGATLSAGQSATLNVIYSPKVAGSFSGQVKLTSTASSSPITINITGSAFTPSTSHTVALTWHSSPSNVVGYYIYRSTSLTAAFARLNSTSITGLDYTDNGVTSGKTYYYAVSAVTKSGAESAKSTTAIVTVP